MHVTKSAPIHIIRSGNENKRISRNIDTFSVHHVLQKSNSRAGGEILQQRCVTSGKFGASLSPGSSSDRTNLFHIEPLLLYHFHFERHDGQRDTHSRPERFGCRGKELALAIPYTSNYY